MALLIVQDVPEALAGSILGMAFTLGYALTVCVQMIALRRAGWNLHLCRPRRAGIATAARDGLALLGSTLPNQLYFRGQLLLSTAWLGSQPTALLIYIRQITAAVTQL